MAIAEADEQLVAPAFDRAYERRSARQLVARSGTPIEPSPVRPSTLSYPSSVSTPRALSARRATRSIVTTWRASNDSTAAA